MGVTFLSTVSRRVEEKGKSWVISTWPKRAKREKWEKQLFFPTPNIFCHFMFMRCPRSETRFKRVLKFKFARRHPNNFRQFLGFEKQHLGNRISGGGGERGRGCSTIMPSLGRRAFSLLQDYGCRACLMRLLAVASGLEKKKLGGCGGGILLLLPNSLPLSYNNYCILASSLLLRMREPLISP